MKYTITLQVRQVLDRYDVLGFDTHQEALAAILDHKDWDKRWEVRNTDDKTIINLWRASTYLDATLALIDAKV